MFYLNAVKDSQNYELRGKIEILNNSIIKSVTRKIQLVKFIH